MSEIKTIEQGASEYALDKYPVVANENFYDENTWPRAYTQKHYIAGGKHQKELSDAREKLLLDVISEMKKRFNEIIEIESTLSSVAKKLEGL